MKTTVVVPWHNRNQLDSFLTAWGIESTDDRVRLQQDRDKEGCAKTKNKGIASAISAGAEVIIVLDDDCFPQPDQTFDAFIYAHEQALKPQSVEMFESVTNPPSRGTPYFNRSITMPVAASMGFWSEVGDYDAPSQLVHGATHPMEFTRKVMFGRYFPLCGMNLAFHASEWPWCQFVDVPRFDDIWQGFLWQKNAYANNKCFNLAGPVVRHSRQSDVWKNLQEEAVNLQRNEKLWQRIHETPIANYEDMRRILEI